MAITKHLFATEAEADAFVAGITYVNDSSVELIGIYEIQGDIWEVQLEDEDVEDDDEDN